MKIIDLLNKIANGEEVPKYIKYYDRLHQKEDTMMSCRTNIIYKLDNNIIDLIDEVEILDDEDEEKGLPEKLENKIDESFENYNYSERMRLTEIVNKINEIIDYLEKQRKGE